MANNMSGHAGYLWYDTLNSASYTDYTYTAVWSTTSEGSSPNADDATLYFHNKFKTNDDDLKVEFVWKSTLVMTYSICNSPTLSTCLQVSLDDTSNQVGTNNQGAGWDNAGMAFSGGTQYNIKLIYNSSLNTFKVYVNNNLLLTSDAVAFNLSNFAYFGFEGVDNAAFIEDYFISDATTIPINKGDVFLNIYKEKTPTSRVTSSITVDLIGNYSETSTTSTGYDYFYVVEPGWYELRFGNDNDYPKRTYFFNVSKGANTVNVYLLHSNYTQTTLLVKDQNSAPLPDTYITLQRNYLLGGNSVYYNLAILKTNSEGKATIVLEPFDAFYKFQFSNLDGTEVYKVTDPTPIVSSTPTFYVNTEQNTNDAFSKYNNIHYNLTFSNQTGNIYGRLQYYDNTNILQKACLKVDYITSQNLQNICYTCLNSTSGTITCQINHTWTGQFKATAEIKAYDEWITLDSQYYMKNPNFSMGKYGIFLAVIIMFTLAFMGLTISPTLSLALLFLGFIIVGIAQFIIKVNMAIFFWVGILCLIAMFLLRRQSQ